MSMLVRPNLANAPPSSADRADRRGGAEERAAGRCRSGEPLGVAARRRDGSTRGHVRRRRGTPCSSTDSPPALTSSAASPGSSRCMSGTATVAPEYAATSPTTPSAAAIATASRAARDADRAGDSGDQAEHGDHADDQHRLVVLAERLDREVLEERRGEVDHLLPHRDHGRRHAQQCGDALGRAEPGGRGQEPAPGAGQPGLHRDGHGCPSGRLGVADGSAAARRDDRVELDLDPPARIEQSGHDHHGRRRTYVGEDLAVRRPRRPARPRAGSGTSGCGRRRSAHPPSAVSASSAICQHRRAWASGQGRPHRRARSEPSPRSRRAVPPGLRARSRSTPRTASPTTPVLVGRPRVDGTPVLGGEPFGEVTSGRWRLVRGERLDHREPEVAARRERLPQERPRSTRPPRPGRCTTEPSNTSTPSSSLPVHQMRASML